MVIQYFGHEMSIGAHPVNRDMSVLEFRGQTLAIPHVVLKGFAQFVLAHCDRAEEFAANRHGPRLDGTAAGSDQTKSGGVFPSEESK